MPVVLEMPDRAFGDIGVQVAAVETREACGSRLKVCKIAKKGFSCYMLSHACGVSGRLAKAAQMQAARIKIHSNHQNYHSSRFPICFKQGFLIRTHENGGYGSPWYRFASGVLLELVSLSW